MIRRTLLHLVCAAGAMTPVGLASADLVGGGVVSLKAWNDEASALIGEPVTVVRLYLAFDPGDPAFHGASTIDDVTISTRDPIVRLSTSRTPPDPFNVLFTPALAWDSFVTINMLTSEGESGPILGIVDFSERTAKGSWGLSGPLSATRAPARPDTEFGTGFDLVLCAQITLRRPGPASDVIDISADRSALGDGGGLLAYATLEPTLVVSPIILRSARASLNAWFPDAQLTNATGRNGDRFGSSASIDGARAIIGAPQRDAGIDGNSNEGGAYLFERRNGVWMLDHALSPPEPVKQARFGADVLIDGDMAIVGAPRHEVAIQADGAVYVYQRIAGAWTLVQTLTAPVTQAGEHFGNALALSGQTLAIGAPGWHGPSGNRLGAVYLYTRTPSGFVLKQIVSDVTPLHTAPQFGSDVALESDLLAVGGTYTAHVFRRIGGVWSEEAELPRVATPSLGGVRVATNGATVVVGGPGLFADAALGTSAYAYEMRGGAWVEVGAFSSVEGERENDFGVAIAMRGDLLAIGGPNDVAAEQPGQPGGVAIFERTGGAWLQTARVSAGDQFLLAPQFGEAIAFDGRTLLIGDSVATTGNPSSPSTLYSTGVVYALPLGDNAPPECAIADPLTLWPPNHQFETLDLTDYVTVSDPDGDDVALRITGISQDEPVNGLGDGNTSCDAMILHDTVFQVRRERSGSGDGRVYVIKFIAEDGAGGRCEGSFEVHVPIRENLPAVAGSPVRLSFNCSPRADTNADRTVDARDLAMLLATWGQTGPDATLNWPDGDIDGNGVCDSQDLAALLAAWGPVDR